MQEKNCYNDMKFMRRCETLDDFPKVEGYDFEKEFNFNEFLDSYARTGIQATNLAKGIEITRAMIDAEAKIFLSCTSNMVSSGVREIIKFLVKNNYVHALSISAGGVEEDIIKTLKPFVLGSFDIPGRVLFEKGVGRIGNIFAPYDRYTYFEKFMNPFFDRIYSDMQKTGVPMTPSEIIKEMGKEVNNEESILYWAYKNDIPVFCPAFTDGAIGDLLRFQKIKRNDFYCDIVGDHAKIVRLALDWEKTGAILLGGGSPKHYVLNANIFREGLDYAVYITTAQEYDASDSGGNEQEAITWAKIRVDGAATKIKCEASIAFPLLVAGTFKKRHDQSKDK